MPARKVKTVGWLAKRMREALGESLHRISDLADVTERVVADIESGVGAIPAMIEQVAPHLKLTYGQLIGIEPPPALDDWEGRTNGRLQDYEGIEDLIQRIRERTGVKGPIIVLAVSEGSIRLRLLMEPQDAAATIKALAEGKLDDLLFDYICVPYTSANEEAVLAITPQRITRPNKTEGGVDLFLHAKPGEVVVDATIPIHTSFTSDKITVARNPVFRKWTSSTIEESQSTDIRPSDT